MENGRCVEKHGCNMIFCFPQRKGAIWAQEFQVCHCFFKAFTFYGSFNEKWSLMQAFYGNEKSLAQKSV